MKYLTKLMALVIVAVLMVTLAASAFATGDTTPTTKSITLTGGKKGHTYTLYQVFTGTVEGNELTNIQWGSGVTETFKATKTTAAAYAKEISEANDARATAQALISASALTAGTTQALTADGDVSFTGLDEGYYIITDTAGDDVATENDYSSALIVKVVKDVSGALKADKPTSEKKVQDVNDSDSSVDTADNWQDSADYDIGDDVPFKITATTANNVTSYKAYHITFQDKKSDGLDAPTGNYTITVLGQTLTLAVNATEAVTTSTESTTISAEIASPDTGNTFAVKVTLTPKSGTYLTEGNSSAIVLSYFMKLNDSAKIGSEGNPNTSYIKYSNNPESSDDSDEGKTPDDKVIVFTYKTVVDKIDKDGNDLNGAGFTLYKVKSDYTLPTEGTNDEKNAAIAAASTSIVTTKTIAAANDKHQFEFKGLDDGTYVLCETTTPNGFNTMEPVKFTISATHDVTKDDPTLLTLTATAPFSVDNKESATVNRTKSGTSHERASGEAYAEIVNNSGATLPETGGIGTTIFYVGGGLLALVAVVLLVTKRRMSAQ